MLSLHLQPSQIETDPGQAGLLPRDTRSSRSCCSLLPLGRRDLLAALDGDPGPAKAS